MISPLDIVVFLMVLGVLVFVHELGHFVAAKACGIYVDRFSLGMPPRLFGFKYGETDYCIGLLPIGGYVKMAGQEDSPLSEEERESTYGGIPPDRWFNNKPIWQRAIVLIAGPAMNLVLALFIYGLMAGYGRDVPLYSVDSRIGFVEEDSPASTAPMYIATEGQATDFSQEPNSEGWQPGDKIISINGKETTRFMDIAVAAILGRGKEATVEIERTGPDGETLRYLSLIEPKVPEGESAGTRYGVDPFHTALVRHVLPDSPAKAQGILPGDVIQSVEGAIVDRTTFSLLVKRLPDNSILTIEVLRDGEVNPIELQTRREGSFSHIAFEPMLNTLVGVGDDAPPAVLLEDSKLLREWGLNKGDKVLTANGESEVGTTLRRLVQADSTEAVLLRVERHRSFFNSSKEAVEEDVSLPLDDVIHALTGIVRTTLPKVALIESKFGEKSGLQRKDLIIEVDGEPATIARLREIEMTRLGETVPIKVRRPSMFFGLVQREKEFMSELTVGGVQQIGVVWGTETVFHREPPGGIIPYAFDESWRQVTQIATVLKGLFTGNLSPKLLGGPVMIGDVVMDAFKSGFFVLLEITAIISVNLAIFNLLPLPVLDGGQLMFLVIETVRRRPVSINVVEKVQQVGFFLIIGMLLFVTFNDISRIVQRWLPWT